MAVPVIREALLGKITEAVRAYGVPVTFVRFSAGVPEDPLKPWGPDSDDDPGTEQFSAYAVEDEFQLRDVDGRNVMDGDKKLVVAVDTIEDTDEDDPQDGSTRLEQFNSVTHAGEVWAIVRILDKAKVGERVVGITYHVRKSGRRAA